LIFTIYFFGNIKIFCNLAYFIFLFLTSKKLNFLYYGVIIFCFYYKKSLWSNWTLNNFYNFLFFGFFEKCLIRFIIFIFSFVFRFYTFVFGMNIYIFNIFNLVFYLIIKYLIIIIIISYIIIIYIFMGFYILILKFCWKFYNWKFYIIFWYLNIIIMNDKKMKMLLNKKNNNNIHNQNKIYILAW
jgi:hypothetical protein